MKKIILLLLVFYPLVTKSQTQYDLGFKEGYKEGFCYNDFSCISPIPPITPIPNLNEDSNSYKDGYNRGFKLGLEDKQKNKGIEEKPIDLSPSYKYSPKTNVLPDAFSREYVKICIYDNTKKQWGSWQQKKYVINFNKQDFKVFDVSTNSAVFQGNYKTIEVVRGENGEKCVLITASDLNGEIQALQLFTDTGDVRYINANKGWVIQFSMNN